MIGLSKASVYNFENALRGARNPMNSWDKSDSSFDDTGAYVLGPSDLQMAMRLCRAGSDHRKFMRQILVSVDILAPLYWWKEFDTYKVGTVANSTSTMHKIHAKPFEMDDFSHDQLDDEGIAILLGLLNALEKARNNYNASKDTAEWYKIIQLIIRLEPAPYPTRTWSICITRETHTSCRSGECFADGWNLCHTRRR